MRQMARALVAWVMLGGLLAASGGETSAQLEFSVGDRWIASSPLHVERVFPDGAKPGSGPALVYAGRTAPAMVLRLGPLSGQQKNLTLRNQRVDVLKSVTVVDAYEQTSSEVRKPLPNVRVSVRPDLSKKSPLILSETLRSVALFCEIQPPANAWRPGTYRISLKVDLSAIGARVDALPKLTRTKVVHDPARPDGSVLVMTQYFEVRSLEKDNKGAEANVELFLARRARAENDLPATCGHYAKVTNLFPTDGPALYEYVQALDRSWQWASASKHAGMLLDLVSGKKSRRPLRLPGIGNDPGFTLAVLKKMCEALKVTAEAQHVLGRPEPPEKAGATVRKYLETSPPVVNDYRIAAMAVGAARRWKAKDGIPSLIKVCEEKLPPDTGGAEAPDGASQEGRSARFLDKKGQPVLLRQAAWNAISELGELSSSMFDPAASLRERQIMLGHVKAKLGAK